MSKPVVYIVTLVVCLLLQVAVAPAIAVGGCSPNFLLIPVCLVSLRSGPAAGGVAGFACGLFEDLAGSGVVGCMALVFSLLAFLLGLLSTGSTATSPAFSAVIGIASSFFVEIGYGIVCVLSSSAQGTVLATLLGYSVPCAIYTALFTVLGLVTISLVLVDDSPSATGLGSLGLGPDAGKVPRFPSRLK